MMNTGIRHPFTNALYELNANGEVEVRDGNRAGTFDREGRWLRGDLRECDPQLCVWITDLLPEQQTASDSHLTTIDAGKGHPLA